MSQIGTTGEIEQASSWSFNPFLQTRTRTFVGEHGDIEALIPTYQAAGWAGTVAPLEGPRSIFHASKIVSTSLETQWELDTQWSNVDAEDCDAFWEYMDGLSTMSDRATALAAIKDAAKEIRDENTTTRWAALADDTQRAWAMDFASNKGYPQPAAVLIRINYYPQDTDFVNDWTDVGKVWTKAQIDALTSAPSAYIGTLPTGSLWLQTSAGMSTDGDGRLIVRTHWVYGRYPTHAFTFKT